MDNTGWLVQTFQFHDFWVSHSTLSGMKSKKFPHNYYAKGFGKMFKGIRNNLDIKTKQAPKHVWGNPKNKTGIRNI